MTHQLLAKNIRKSYKKLLVLNDANLQIESGKVVGLLGPNGAGKTTCFYIISGLIKANSGSVFLDDVDISHFPIEKRSLLGLGYLPQESSIFRGLTVADNILAVLQVNKKTNKKQRLDQLDELLTNFKITHLRNSLGVSLSGGERRRVEIARILAMKPKFILFDEPFAGVDPIAVFDLQKLIFGLKDKGIGVLITDHNFRELLDTCDYAYVLNNGEILTKGSKADILRNQQVQMVYLGEKTN